MSILPYLQNDISGIKLHIELDKEVAADFSSSRSPFRPVPHKDLLSRIFRGTIASDTGQKIIDIFMLVSPDEYESTFIDLDIISNTLIEQIWTESYSFYRNSPSTSVIFLRSQTDSQGKFRRFESLLFCKKKNIYFSPVCPTCGKKLALAENDQLLENAGLPTFSRHHQRFLHCPACRADGTDGNVTFYVLKKEADVRQRSDIADFQQLVRSWRNLVQNKVLTTTLPCIGCASRSRCFGDENAAAHQVTPFSFYPFYLLIFKAPDLTTANFLELAAGGRPPAGYPATRGRSHLFDKDDERFFLEALYLKLSLLSELYRNFPTTGHKSAENMAYLFDKVWIELTPLPGPLPYLWTLKPMFIGLLDDLRELIFPISKGCNPKFQCAILWFQALCVNQRHDLIKVNAAIRRLLALLENNPAASWEMVRGNSWEVFQAESLLWEPASFSLPQASIKLWEETMATGLELLREALTPDSTGDLADFTDKIDQLAAKCRQYMLTAYDDKPAGRQATGEDAEIYEILRKVRKKLVPAAAEPEPPRETLRPETPRPESHPESHSGPASTFAEETLPLERHRDEKIPDEKILAETIIVSSTENNLFAGPAEPAHRPAAEPQLNPAATLTNDPDRAATNFNEDDDLLEETVILRPPDKSR